MNVVYRTYLSLVLLVLYLPASGQVRLPRLVGDGMVLQRDADVNIWGWAGTGEKISVHFLGSQYNVTANVNGEWTIQLPKLKPGGPHKMAIKGSNTITLSDILIGDVWVCSGQSNMELPMVVTRSLYEDEIAASANTFIRQFNVPKKYSFKGPQQDLVGGSWQHADPKNVLQFSAVAYFFAKDLYSRYKIPIGIINATLGGSRAESWMSEGALKPFPTLYEDGRKYKDSTVIARTESDDRKRISEWSKLSVTNDQAYNDPGGRWSKPETDVTAWDKTAVPGYWVNGNLNGVNGVVWFRRDFQLPSSMVGVEARLLFGRIVDSDSVFINGNFVGTTGSQYVSRSYRIPAKFLKAGKNTLVARIVNNSGKGGFVPGKPYMIVSGKDTVDLSGDWRYKPGVLMEPLAPPTLIIWKPTGLYNGMLAPLFRYSIKGTIWYQGESNVSRAVEYRALFPALIKNWRDQWQQGDFPFLFVQLPNYNERKDEPSESNWALLREAQLKTLLLPKTGMAVAIDVGEWNDIHPLNKRDIGLRLSRVAQHVAYGDRKMVYSGPVYQSMKISGHRIILAFSHTGSGLVAKGGTTLRHFAIAGADKKFVWANAEIKDNSVVVWSDQVPDPKAVRYAWADDPEEANLYNKEGLPATPFRTDNY